MGLGDGAGTGGGSGIGVASGVDGAVPPKSAMVRGLLAPGGRGGFIGPTEGDRACAPVGVAVRLAPMLPPPLPTPAALMSAESARRLEPARFQPGGPAPAPAPAPAADAGLRRGLDPGEAEDAARACPRAEDDAAEGNASSECIAGEAGRAVTVACRLDAASAAAATVAAASTLGDSGRIRLGRRECIVGGAAGGLDLRGEEITASSQARSTGSREHRATEQRQCNNSSAFRWAAAAASEQRSEGGARAKTATSKDKGRSLCKHTTRSAAGERTAGAGTAARALRRVTTLLFVIAD